MNRINLKAFTLFELLLSMSLIAMIAVFAIPFFQSFQFSNELEVANDIVAQSLRRAQLLSANGENDSSWGVYVQSGSVTIFEGTSYATRVVASDEISEISTRVNIAGLQEIVFQKLTGETANVGTIILSIAGDTRNININSKGRITY